MDLQSLSALDAADPLRRFRDEFLLPEGVIYLAGNSLGPLSKPAAARVEALVREEWARSLVAGWTDHDWLGAPGRVGDGIGRLVGAAPGEVIVADSTSVDLFKLAAAALQAAPDERPVLLMAEDDFPTDAYVAEAAARLCGRRLRRVPRAALLEALDADTALVVLTHVDYRTGEVWDLAATTAAARAAGATALWDLSHTAGVLQVDLNGAGAELAVGCGYKYLNGGPGAPAWLYVARRLQARLASPLSGWMGHAAPFDFAPGYRPAEGIGRFLAGTPPMLGLAALEGAVELLAQADPAALQAKARRLGDMLLQRLAETCPELEPACPGPGQIRGGHVAFRHPQARALTAALARAGVVGDLRPPNLLRFGLSPLYLGYQDVGRAAALIRQVLDGAAVRA